AHVFGQRTSNAHTGFSCQTRASFPEVPATSPSPLNRERAGVRGETDQLHPLSKRTPILFARIRIRQCGVLIRKKLVGPLPQPRVSFDNSCPRMQICSVMAVSLTPQNKRTLKRLLKTGRWNNESEVIRYGLHLVNKEVDGGQNLSPYTAAELRRALGA